jgi:hypothetical protein
MPYVLLAGLVFSIPAIEELPGGEFGAVAFDMQSCDILAWTLKGDSLFYAGEGMPFPDAPCTVSLREAMGFLCSACAGSPDLSDIPGSPDMGEGRASEVAQEWDLRGWVDTGEGYRNFLLVARSQDGRNIGLVLMSRELCCPGKADLALTLLWQTVEGD